MGQGWYEGWQVAARPTPSTTSSRSPTTCAGAGSTPPRLACEGAPRWAAHRRGPQPRADLFGSRSPPSPGRRLTCLDPLTSRSLRGVGGVGNPLEAAAYGWMAGYAPYDNVREQAYLAILATTSLHDTCPWSPSRRGVGSGTARTGDQRSGVRADPAARRCRPGNGGRSGRYDAWREVAWSGPSCSISWRRRRSPDRSPGFSQLAPRYW